jgi:hypothetical protein
MPGEDPPTAIGTRDNEEIIIERTIAQTNARLIPQEMPQAIHPLREQAQGIRPSYP